MSSNSTNRNDRRVVYGGGFAIPPVLRYFISRWPGVITVADDVGFSPARNVNGRVCDEHSEGAFRWTRGGPGVASVGEQCLKAGDGSFAWSTVASGGTVGLAAHELDISTHGITSAIVGTTETQSLSNKTLTTPTISATGFTNAQHAHAAANSGGQIDHTTLTSIGTNTHAQIDTHINAAAAHGTGGGQIVGTTLTQTLTNKSIVASQLTGTVATARLGSGTATSAVFLRGDQTWSDLPIVPGVWPSGHIASFGSLGTSNGQFTTIRGIAVNSSGDVYVSSDNRIQKFSSNGTYLSTVATVGSGNGQVNTPAGLAVDSTNRLHVADSANNRIQYFSSADAYAGKFGTVGTGLGNLSGPLGLHVDGSGIRLVADTGNNRIYWWAADDSPSTTDTAFTAPQTVRRQPIGFLKIPYVVEPSLDSVRRFDVVDSAEMSINVSGNGGGELDDPRDLAFDNLGNIWIVDSGNHRINVYGSSGVFQGSFGSFGTGDGEFNTPTAIAVTSTYVYVADSGNSRIQIFSNPIEQPGRSMGIPFIVYDGGTATVWTNMPAAATEFFGLIYFRKQVDLTGMSQFRLVAELFVAGAAGAKWHVEYSTDGGTVWTDAGTLATQEIAIGTTGWKTGTWTSLGTGARTDVLLRLMGTGGDGVADPFPTNVMVQVR